MQHDETSNRRDQNLTNLEDLGFGSESLLMTDPKLFMDSAFLAIVTAEFAQELGEDCSRLALTEIGRHHGLSDARRTLTAQSMGDSDRIPSLAPGGPNLAMQFAQPPRPSEDFTLRGVWPECHEASARLSRQGASVAPSCHLSVGYTEGWLAEIYNAEVQVVEIACRSSKSDQCQFEAHLKSLDRGQAPSPPANTGLASPLSDSPSTSQEHEQSHAYPVAGLAESFLPEATDSETSLFSHIDPENNSVHAWGPVMVLPFGDPKLAESTVRALEQDEFTEEIRAVIIDLRGQPVDPNAGFVSIEHILKMIDRWQAQLIFAGVSDANRGVLKAFEFACPLGHEKLSEAIALGFRIAEAQRRDV